MTDNPNDPIDTAEDESPIEESPQNDELAEEERESDDGGSRLPFSGRTPRSYLLWGAFGLSLFLAVISALSLYLQIGSIIGIWIEPRYEPLVRAGFDLVVLLLASYTALSFANRLGMRE